MMLLCMYYEYQYFNTLHTLHHFQKSNEIGLCVDKKKLIVIISMLFIE